MKIKKKNENKFFVIRPLRNKLSGLKILTAQKLTISLFLALPLVARAGIISDAPSISSILLRALQYLLYIFGFLAIIGLIASGLMYILAGGERNVIEKAKKSFYWSITGIAIALGSLLILRTIAKIITG